MSDFHINNLMRCANDAIERPSEFGYWGTNDMFDTWGFCGIDKHRDSKLIDLSNFETITQKLIEEFPDDFRIERYRHWAVGWVERLVVRVFKSSDNKTEENITQAFIRAMEWKDNLDDYPIADEHHYDEMLFLDCIDFIGDLPSFFKDNINMDIEDWIQRIYLTLVDEMNIVMYPSDGIYPKDNEIIEAIFLSGLWVVDEDGSFETWNNFCEDNGYEQFKVTTEVLLDRNPNQLRLFNKTSI